ncbi:Early nodulin-like protein 1 [Acorus gramineus]|uniref:Early nodulin-like protein 1 n=1 Tax=Acorus gramineus TaxID=55184 RepID=A0AAV9B7P3_ACOGR|nr:Early nodulin-like protein 1 [Acorus gramineus]
MASHLNTSLKLLLVIFFTSSLHHHLVESFEFEVGERVGWVIPPSNNTTFYNTWASKNRFEVGDTLNFKYKKDSVMAVSEIDYRRCVSTHPTFYSNNRDTDFPLKHPGTFYFISGASGHCEKGQRMIIKVLDRSQPSDSPPPPPSHNSTSPPSSAGGVSTGVSVLGPLQMLVVFTVGSLMF